MGATHPTMTIAEHCQSKGLQVDTARMRWNALRKNKPALFEGGFDRHAPLSDTQALLLFADPKNGKAKRETQNDIGEKFLVVNAKTKSETLSESAKNDAKDETKETPKQETKSASILSWNNAPLFAVFFTVAAASLNNMIEVTGAMKSGSVTAWALTIAFTGSPLMFMLSGVPGAWKWATVGVTMAYKAFCNAIAIYGSLVSFSVMDDPMPSVFMHTVGNFFDCNYLETARFLAGIMAVIVEVIELSAIKNIK